MGERNEEMIKALSPWKKNHQDHKRILESIYELKEEVEKLKEEKFNYNVFLEEKHNMIIMINELKEENEKLK